jgi:DNA (cytosine-5)-methyltransferase 1
VRREWARYPQEAHLLETINSRIRRLTAREIERIQGFEDFWFDLPDVSVLDGIKAAGDAVPPPVSRAIFTSIVNLCELHPRTVMDVCAGAGGLASGVRGISSLETVCLVDRWHVAGRILRHQTLWDPNVVHVADIRSFNLGRYARGVGILCGGFPCQPWSRAGSRRGMHDDRDLLTHAPEMLTKIRPSVFVLENVPGLVGLGAEDYFNSLMARLRRPGSGIRYAVLAAIINAADYGVPQVRKRLFILGLSEASTVDVAKVLNMVESLATHAQSWRPVGDSLESTADREWMQWLY